MRQMDELVTGDDGGDLYRLDRNQNFGSMGLDDDISKSKGGDEVEELTHGVSLLADESVHITPGFFQVCIYASRCCRRGGGGGSFGENARAERFFFVFGAFCYLYSIPVYP